MLEWKQIKLDDERLLYTGRIGWRDASPAFVFPATSLRFRFRGTAKITVENHRQYWSSFLGVIVDGQQRRVRLAETGETVIDIPGGGSAEHEALVFKRMDGCHEVALRKLMLAGELLSPPPRPHRRMEVYGDSVSAGELAEAEAYVGRADPEHDGEYSNSWYSYSWMTARLLGAELHDIAQGGIALMDKTGWFQEPEHVGMESVWDKVHYNKALHEPSLWDFSRWQPQLVLVAIGQNDSNPLDYMRRNPHGEEARRWKAHYRGFLQSLRGVYPLASIVCITTLLEHDRGWDDAIGEVCGSLADPRITHYLFRRNGRGTPGHLRIFEAYEMAEELVCYIEGLQIQGW
ncbi:MAG: hypothetical protein NC180_07715 [Muribaculaceae bacterium]|nr:electron transporter RnfD [Roseburia sp.]MCM1430162.1 hypothetical protein [Muribaculaceae bacterium]MCM1493093.1 hypothetical protein [Muribaculaceae bacterium]